MKVVGADYTRGCNFASSGSTATNITTFALPTQLNQFLRFRSSVLEALHQIDTSTSTANDSSAAAAAAPINLSGINYNIT